MKSKKVTRRWHERKLRKLREEFEDRESELRAERDRARGERDMPLMGDFGKRFCLIFDEHDVPQDDRVFYLVPAACRAVVKAGKDAVFSALDVGLRSFEIDDHADLQLYGMAFRQIGGARP